MRLSIKLKLFSGFGLVLLLLIFMSFISFNMVENVEEANTSALDQMEDIVFVVEKEIDHLDWLNNLADSFVLGSSFTGQLDYTQCDFGLWYYRLLDSPELNDMPQNFRDTFRRIEEPHRELHMTAQEIVQLRAEGTQMVVNDEDQAAGVSTEEQALAIYAEDTQRLITELRELLEQLTVAYNVEKDLYVASAVEQGEAAQRLILLMSIGALFLGMVIAFLIGRGITKPLFAVVESLKDMAERGGDLTRRIDVKSKDELGDLAYWFNTFIGKLHDVISQVSDSASLVSSASNEISAGNQDLSQRTEEQASSIEEVSSTIEEVTSSLQSSAGNSTEADNLSKETLSTVKDGEKVTTEMEDAMKEITNSSEAIAEIISKVNDIAFQTNLLALNAAVEAARAGEQGRGFAVVAAEVRNLAGRTVESSKEIENLITESIKRVERGNDLMSETKSVLHKIVTNTQKVSEVVAEISASLSEQSTAAGVIRSAIEELNQVTQQNASLVEEIASSSESMSSESIDLSELVGQFKVDSTKNIGKREKLTSGKNPSKKNKKREQKTADTADLVAFDEESDFDESDFEKF